jgi:hypothetical protein
MKVTHIFTMATPVNCCFTYQDYPCFHDLCRKKREAQKDYYNAIERKLDKAKLNEYAIKFRETWKPINDLWAIFLKHEANLVPPEWQETYLKYREEEVLRKARNSRIY